MSNDARLIDAYDAAMFDLDGVVYLGPIAVPGAADGIAGLRAAGVRVGFVTNNAARSSAAVASHLVELGIEATGADVVTSAQAAAELVRERYGAGTRVFAVGGAGVSAAVAEAGLAEVASADDAPVAVIQGWGVDLTWAQLNEAAVAIHRGAHWVATNTDPTRPTDRGLVPGNGAAVAAVRMAVAVDPEVAGKPFRPLMAATVARLGAQRPIFVGDRLDTDVAGAVTTGLDSMLVLTGSHGPADLLAAGPAERPTHLGYDLRALLAPARVRHLDEAGADCNGQRVVRDGAALRLATRPDGREEWVDACWAAAALSWAAADDGRDLDSTRIVAELAIGLHR